MSYLRIACRPCQYLASANYSVECCDYLVLGRFASDERQIHACGRFHERGVVPKESYVDRGPIVGCIEAKVNEVKSEKAASHGSKGLISDL